MDLIPLFIKIPGVIDFTYERAGIIGPIVFCGFILAILFILFCFIYPFYDDTSYYDSKEQEAFRKRYEREERYKAYRKNRNSWKKMWK